MNIWFKAQCGGCSGQVVNQGYAYLFPFHKPAICEDNFKRATALE